MNPSEFFDIGSGICEQVLTWLSDQSNSPQPGQEACHRLFALVLDTAFTLELLTESPARQGKDLALDAMSLLRVSYDAHVQALWLIQDARHTAARATDFHNYAWIERLQMRKVLDNNSHPVAQMLAASPKRQQVEPLQDELLFRIGERFLTNEGRAEYAKAGKPYLASPRAKYRRHWYEGDLRVLSKAVGHEDEYRVIVEGSGHAAIHSSPLALLGHAGPPIGNLRFAASQFALRVASRISVVFSVPLPSDDTQILKDIGASVINR